MTISNPAKPAKSPARRALDIVCSAVGIAVGAYSGVNIVIAGIAIGIVLFILSKTRWIKSKALLFAASVQAGHAIWMLVGLAAALAAPANVYKINVITIAEIAAYAVLVTLLVWRQAKWIAILLLIYQAYCIVVHVVMLSGMDLGANFARALAAHLLLRIIAIACMVQYLREKPKEDLVSAF